MFSPVDCIKNGRTQTSAQPSPSQANVIRVTDGLNKTGLINLGVRQITSACACSTATRFIQADTEH